MNIIFLIVVAAPSGIILQGDFGLVSRDDYYKQIGETNVRMFGRCNYSYTWIIVPAGAHQDIYAHASACHMLNEKSFKSNLLEYERDDDKTDILSMNTEVKSAQMVDLQTLDALLQGVRVDERWPTNQPLVSDERLFYLSNRLAQHKILAMLRPGRLPKIEIIPPPTDKVHFFPNYVLCYSKKCFEVLSSSTTRRPESTVNKNSTFDNLILLVRVKQENMKLNTQLVIYKVLIALAAFMCLLLGIAALFLCFRLRMANRLTAKRNQNILRQSKVNATANSSVYKMNGSAQPSYNPSLVYVDPSQTSYQFVKAASDKACLDNFVKSRNPSSSEFLHSNGNNGSLVSGYALQEGSGVFRLVQVPSHKSIQNVGNVVYQSASPCSLQPFETFNADSIDGQSNANSENLVSRHTPNQPIPFTSCMDNCAGTFSSVSQLPYFHKSFESTPPVNYQVANTQGSIETVIRRFPGNNSTSTFCPTVPPGNNNPETFRDISVN